MLEVFCTTAQYSAQKFDGRTRLRSRFRFSQLDSIKICHKQKRLLIDRWNINEGFPIIQLDYSDIIVKRRLENILDTSRILNQV